MDVVHPHPPPLSRQHGNEASLRLNPDRCFIGWRAKASPDQLVAPLQCRWRLTPFSSDEARVSRWKLRRSLFLASCTPTQTAYRTSPGKRSGSWILTVQEDGGNVHQLCGRTSSPNPLRGFGLFEPEATTSAQGGQACACPPPPEAAPPRAGQLRRARVRAARSAPLVSPRQGKSSTRHGERGCKGRGSPASSCKLNSLCCSNV